MNTKNIFCYTKVIAFDAVLKRGRTMHVSNLYSTKTEIKTVELTNRIT